MTNPRSTKVEISDSLIKKCVVLELLQLWIEIVFYHVQIHVTLNCLLLKEKGTYYPNPVISNALLDFQSLWDGLVLFHKQKLSFVNSITFNYVFIPSLKCRSFCFTGKADSLQENMSSEIVSSIAVAKSLRSCLSFNLNCYKSSSLNMLESTIAFVRTLCTVDSKVVYI